MLSRDPIHTRWLVRPEAVNRSADPPMPGRGPSPRRQVAADNLACHAPASASSPMVGLGGVRVRRHADWSYQGCRSCGGAAMSGYQTHPPELVPILSRGKHRNPRKGACFMELASYLAGERWSDHPACTHPLLAAAARDVNDYTSDANRARLAGLIPSVIGLTGEDLHLDARIALRCARMALPVVTAERQRVMAVSVLACERVLATLDGRPAGGLEEASRHAL